MSHFSCLVIGDNVKAQLAPFHEFECTGTDDQYVQDLDITEKTRKEYDGRDEEHKGKSLAEWVEYYDGKSVVPHGSKPDLEEEHKYGYALADEAGNVIKVIDRTNKNAKWDWWQVGGRYSNRLLLKNGTRVNAARKGDVDFFGLERDAASTALNDYLLARTCIDQHPPIETWEIIRERNGDSIQAARDEYHAQPLIMAFRKFNAELGYKCGLDGPEEFLVTREQYLQDAVDRAFTFYATVKDQQWSQKGEMGWFGMESNEMTQAEWNAKFKAIIAELPDDAILTVVDCHI